MAMTCTMPLEGVYHIVDDLGVCMTLLCGRERALLVDTGYGLNDVGAYIRTLTDLPVQVVLTHGHHDHCMGARWFDETFMFAEDTEDFVFYTGMQTRQRIVQSAMGRGVAVPQDYLTAVLPLPKPLQEQTIDLGGMTAQLIHCPGHTPGSCVVYVPERSLMLTGDDWNPCTWLFFPKALGIADYRRNVQQLFELPFEHVLCSHQPMMFDRSRPETFLQHLTDEAIRSAFSVNISPYEEIDTVQCDLPEGQLIVFDRAKAVL